MSMLFVVLLNLSFALTGLPYPKGPDAGITPGTLCERPTEYRYREKIRYCERNVDHETKDRVIRRYDTELGFHVQQMPRREFKIDHHIPLCMGGSNEAGNLWPQHKSVYTVTDPMEGLSCEKMAAGRLLQARAIELIREGKRDHSRVPAILKHLEAL